MFPHLRIKIWYAAAPFRERQHTRILWIAILNRQSYQKVINWPPGQKKWVRASALKGVWQPLAASQTLCYPHLWVGKIALRPVATNGPRWHSALRGDAVILCFPLFRSPPAELSPAPQIRFKTRWKGGTLSLPQSRHTAGSTGGHRRVDHTLELRPNRNSSFSRKKQSPRWLCSLHRIRCLLCISSPAE